MNGFAGIRSQRRETVGVEVARQLLDHLLSGEAKPGDRLPSERSLAESSGVGRSAVREALQSLSLLGLVEIRPGDGTYVGALSSDLLPSVIEWGLLLGEKRVSDLVEARSHIEIIVAGLAATRRSEEEATQLREYVEQMKSGGRDVERFTDADLSFHTLLAAASGNETFKNVLASLRSLLRVWMGRTLEHEDADFDPFIAEHERIVEAVEGRDPVAARAAMSAHMSAALARLNQTFPDSAPRPPS